MCFLRVCREAVSTNYNVDFLIAGIVVMAIVLFQFAITRANRAGISTRVFFVMLSVCFVDVCLDVATAAMIEDAASYDLGALYFFNSVFYLAQVFVTALLFYYTVAICNNFKRENALPIVLSSVPIALFAVLILLNPLTGMFFSFDAQTHEYVHGGFIYALYSLAVFYTVVSIGYATMFRKLIRGIDYLSIWEFCVIAMACITLQALDTNLLMTGFGIGMGALVVFLAVNNADGMFDVQSKVFDVEGFRRHADMLIERKKDFSLVFVSLEKLKTLNKLAGPGVSDAIVLDTAQKLRMLSRTNMVFRMKGSLFAVICESRREQRRIYSSITTWLEGPRQESGYSTSVTYRAAMVYGTSRFESSDQIYSYIEYLVSYMRRLDCSSLPEDRDYFDDYMQERLVSDYVKEAIEKNLLLPYAQPLFGVKEQRYVGFEILARLIHPELGFISPLQFIRLAEEDGTVGELAKLQMKNTCAFIAQNKARIDSCGIAHFKMNVSAVEVVDPALPERILSSIEDNDLPPSMFDFEITETAATKYGETAEDFVVILKESGCNVYLDDFGSGYANLDSVMHLPFSGVKMDMSLLRRADEDSNTRILYAGLVSLMKTIGKRIVSEGVETEAQRTFLESLEVDELQGYLLCRPLPLEEALSFVESENARLQTEGRE